MAMEVDGRPRFDFAVVPKTSVFQSTDRHWPDSSSAILPPIGFLSSRMSRDEEMEFQPRRSALPALDTSATPIPRSSSPYQVPRPYTETYTSHPATTAAQGVASFAQRRSSGEQSDSPTVSAQGTRYSLPSLYEALGIDKTSPRSSRNHSAASILPRTSHAAEPMSPKSHAPPQHTPDSGYTPHKKDSPFSWNASRPPYIGHIGPASPVRKAARLHRSGSSTPPHSNHQGVRPHMSHAVRYGSDPSSYSRDDSSFSSTQHKRYSEPSLERHIMPLNAKDSSNASFPPTSAPQHPPQSQQPPWAINDVPQPGDSKRPAKPPYGESVKRQLEVFDLEQALNGVSDLSKQLLDFSEFYRQKAHQTQRSGPLPGSTPHIQEIDDMMDNGSRIQEALNRIRDVVVNQQAALAERSREQAMKSSAQVADDPQSFHDESKDGGFNGSDPKRRRGRAAPPGRCHSCNRAETPEWRRGPDGARTLCNACGLHYAKLTRKMGAAKASLGSSNLRPKSLDSGTTVS